MIHKPIKRHTRRRKIEWRPTTKLIAYLVAVAVLITWFPSITTGPNAVIFAVTIPAMVWIGCEMRGLK